MRIKEGDVVVLVAGELDDARRQMLTTAGIDADARVIEHVVVARVDSDHPDTGGRHVIISREVSEE